MSSPTRHPAALPRADVAAGLAALLWVWIRPGPVARDLADRGRSLPGVVAVAAAGLLWSALCLWLALDGHGPSRGLGLLAGPPYYFAQAALMVPALLLGWQLNARVARRVAGPSVRSRPTVLATSALAAPYAAAILILFVGPELVVYPAAGFEALGRLIRVTGPVLLIGAWTLSVLGLRGAFEVSLGRAIVATGAGLWAQALLLAVIVR